MSGSVEAVIFDWGGTLTPWHTVAAGDAWHAAVGDRELAARLHAAENAAWVRSRDEQRSTARGRPGSARFSCRTARFPAISTGR